VAAATRTLYKIMTTLMTGP
jgi:hypothetical protein